MSDQPQPIKSIFQSRLQAKLPGLDPVTIITIIQAVLAALTQALGGVCPKPPTPANLKQMMSDRDLEAELAINRELRNKGIRPRSPLGRQAREAVFQVSAEATDDEFTQFIQAAN